MNCQLVDTIEAEYYIKATGKLIELEDHQRRILNHAFTPQMGKMPYRTVVYSTPKKEGKTAIAGAVTHASVRVYGGNCYSIANDEEQASSRMFTRVVESLELMREKDTDRFERAIDPKWHKVIHKNAEIRYANDGQINPDPHWLRYIASDYAGEAGGMPALTVWDELWAYRSSKTFRLYDEMQPIPNLPISMRFITTYAGWYGESELLFAIYEAVVKPNPHTGEPEGERIPELEDLPVFRLGSTLVYWDNENRMPWKTPEFLEEARNDPALNGRESEYRRIWKNQWTTGEEAFLDMELIDELMAYGKEAGLTNHFA